MTIESKKPARLIMAPFVIFNCHFKKVGSKSFSFSLQMFGWRRYNSQKMRNHWCYLSAQGGTNSLPDFETRCSGQGWLRGRSTNRFTYKTLGRQIVPLKSLDRLSKRQLPLPTTVLLRTTLTWTIQLIYCSTLEVKKKSSNQPYTKKRTQGRVPDIRLLPTFCVCFLR